MKKFDNLQLTELSIMRRKRTSSKAKQTKKSLNKQYKQRRSSIPTMHPKDPGDMYNSSRRMGNSRDTPKNGFFCRIKRKAWSQRKPDASTSNDHLPCQEMPRILILQLPKPWRKQSGSYCCWSGYDRHRWFGAGI